MKNKLEELFPYIENDINDIAIREHNQRMHDKRDAFLKGVSTANESIISYLEKENFFTVSNYPSLRKKLNEIITQIDSCNYESEAGPLKDNISFIDLKNIAES